MKERGEVRKRKDERKGILGTESLINEEIKDFKEGERAVIWKK